jgi:hypothetical protein
MLHPTPIPNTGRGANIRRSVRRAANMNDEAELTIAAVEPEADGIFSRTAIEVIDEQGLYLLSHDSSMTSR